MQVLYHPSLSFHQLPCSSAIPTIFRFSSHFSSLSSRGFLLIDSRLWFSSSISHYWLGRFFIRDIILWDSSAFLQSYDLLIFPRFSISIFLIGLEGFPPSFHSLTNDFHAQKSSRLRRKAIVMSWLWDLPITWSQHVTTHMISSHDPDTWPTNFILTSNHYQY